MILFYAAAESALPELSEIGANRLLISMANGKTKIPKVPEHFDSYELIIDSGAFTYHKKGGIELDKWIELATGLADYGTELIALDVIGNPEASLSNWLEISKHVAAVPTFHMGSDISYLKKYLEHTDRIALGGMVPYKSEIGTLRRFLNEIFSQFSPESLPKFHSFGYFSQQILENYPFYSADASTWQNYSRFGEHHRFENFQYKRIKSLKVEKTNLRSAEIEDLTLQRLEDPVLKLQAIKEALDNFEHYLTALWQKRGIVWETGKN